VGAADICVDNGNRVGVVGTKSFGEKCGVGNGSKADQFRGDRSDDGSRDISGLLAY